MPEGEPDIAELLTRMRNGDREAAAAFIARYGERIRRRVRSRIRPQMRRLFDSQDILSTVARRLDGYVRTGGLQAQSEAQLWALAFRIAENATIDKGRLVRRLRETEGDDASFARHVLEQIERSDAAAPETGEITIEKIVAMVSDPVDREILLLWLNDTPHTATAEIVGLAPTAVRKRWQIIKERIRERLEVEASP